MVGWFHESTPLSFCAFFFSHVYHIEQKSAEAANTPQRVLQEMLNSHRANDATLSRFAPIDLTTLQVYEEFR